MNKKRKSRKIKKSDYPRVIVTETLPYETPIIFSNEGFYNNIVDKTTDKIRDLIRSNLIFSVDSKATIPYKYKIRKNSLGDILHLALIHPKAQWRIKQFYEKYEQLIPYLCSESPISIRSPEKIASTFYIKTIWENINQYKSGNVTQLKFDSVTKYSPSYFAYKYDQYYKFFDSRDYYHLEKSFDLMWMMDVAKCFPSIYTHSLSWAVKDKNFTKLHRNIQSTFAQEFDAVMRYTNNDETNGIIIGPEVSRIFAEIIFQAIDCKVIEELKNKNNLNFSKHYEIRRYVDDILIFSNTEINAKIIYECYSNTLLEFNLHTNRAKSDRLKRPFLTKKSKVIIEVSNEINEFISRFFNESDHEKLIPKIIFNRWSLTNNFIKKIKSICSYNETVYDEISSYLIATFTKRIKKLVNVRLKSRDSKQLENYKDAILVLLDVLYFFYNVSPSVRASYNLSISVTVLTRFSRKYLGKYADTIYQRIYELTSTFLSSETAIQHSGFDELISLEGINVFLAIRELGDHYLLPEETIHKLFKLETIDSYFEIVSCLFYIRNDVKYKVILNKIVKAVDRILKDLTDIQTNTEKACLLLDMLSCPYIYDRKKSDWIKRLYSSLQIPPPTIAELNAFLTSSPKNYWFVKWADLDLLNSLEKKELKAVY